MKRERGVSSLAMVLLLLVLGSLLLQGANQQQASFSTLVATESRALQRQAVAQAALEWGRMQSWSAQAAVECRQYTTPNARVCLRLLANNPALLIAQYDGASVWRLGAREESGVVFSPHGWSDFCPLSEVALCQIP